MAQESLSRFLLPVSCIISQHTFSSNDILSLKLQDRIKPIMIRKNFMLFFRAKLHIIPKNTILQRQMLTLLGDLYIATKRNRTFLKCVIQLHYVYRPVFPVIEMTAPVDLSCVLESAFLHYTSRSEAYRKSTSASESSHGRRMSLSVSIMIQVAILILLAEVYIFI